LTSEYIFCSSARTVRRCVTTGPLLKRYLIQSELQTRGDAGTAWPWFLFVCVDHNRVIKSHLNQRYFKLGFVFGDLASGASRNPYGPPPGAGGGSTLPLPTSEVAEQLGLEMQPKPLVIFVTRQIGLDFLYGDLRNKTPDYRVLSDFADPLRTTFRSPQLGPGGWYGASYPNSTRREPSLRQVFNLPERALSLVAFDATGNVVYVKADAAAEFLPSLAEARKAVKK
jgi:hypothetical protein